MLTIKRLVLRLPPDYRGRPKDLGRLISASLGRLEPGGGLEVKRLVVNAVASPVAGDSAIAGAAARSVGVGLNASRRRSGS